MLKIVSRGWFMILCLWCQTIKHFEDSFIPKNYRTYKITITAVSQLKNSSCAALYFKRVLPKSTSKLIINRDTRISPIKSARQNGVIFKVTSCQRRTCLEKVSALERCHVFQIRNFPFTVSQYLPPRNVIERSAWQAPYKGWCALFDWWGPLLPALSSCSCGTIVLPLGTWR